MAGTSSKSVFKGIRIPNHLMEKIDAYADENSLNTSQAIIELLGLGLRRQDDKSASDYDVRIIKKDVQAICKKLGITDTYSSVEPTVLYGVCETSLSSISNAHQCYAWFLLESMAVSYVDQLNRQSDLYKVVEKEVVLSLA